MCARVRVHECLVSLLTRVRRCREAESSRRCDASSASSRASRQSHNDSAEFRRTTLALYQRFSFNPPPPNRKQHRVKLAFQWQRQFVWHRVCSPPHFFPHMIVFFFARLSPMRWRKSATYVQQCHLEVTHCHTTVQCCFFPSFFSSCTVAVFEHQGDCDASVDSMSRVLNVYFILKGGLWSIRHCR